MPGPRWRSCSGLPWCQRYPAPSRIPPSRSSSHRGRHGVSERHLVRRSHRPAAGSRAIGPAWARGTMETWRSDANKTSRDMVMSMGVLSPSCVDPRRALRQASRSLGVWLRRPAPIPTADVTATFTNAKGVLTSFPITVPQDIPAEWHPNSLRITDPKSTGQSDDVADGPWRLAPAGRVLRHACRVGGRVPPGAGGRGRQRPARQPDP